MVKVQEDWSSNSSPVIMNNSVSIIIPAHNEEKNIKKAVVSVLMALKGIADYEVIVINDGSTDKTGKIINYLSKKNRHIKVIHRDKNLGIGYNFQEGIRLSRKEFIGGFPGDNDMSWKSLKNLLEERGKKDIILSYMANPGKRSWKRRFISRTYVVLMNALFGYKLKYYNGYFICKSKLLKSLKLDSWGFAIFAEITVKLLHSGASYVQIPFYHTGRKYGRSSAVTLKSIFKSFITMLRMFYAIHFA